MSSLLAFETIVRATKNVGIERGDPTDQPPQHPFDERNIHSDISKVSRPLFDDGHYSQATFEAFKFLDLTVQSLSGINDSGHNLMMNAFNEKKPKIKLTDLANTSETDEQYGFRYIFAGAMSAIRNPRGHAIANDPIDRCLDHLSLASVLLRRLEERKEPIPTGTP